MSDLHLFKNLVSNSGENAFTEALAATLKASAVFLEQFLLAFRWTDPDCTVETQRFYPEGKPDIQISSRKTFLLVEVKWNAPLTLEQWRKYQSILSSRSETFKLLASIITPSTLVHRRILAQPSARLLKWTDVYKIAQRSLVREKNSIPKFLLRELIDLLEQHSMKPFDRFSNTDVNALKGFYAAIAKMGVFFGEVLAILKEESKTKHKGKISVEDSGYQIETWKGYPNIYAGNTFSINWKHFELWGWIGCHFSQQGPILQLYVGDEGRKQIKREVFDRILKSNDFQYEEEEKSYDSYFRDLSVNLITMSSRDSLPRDVAIEIKNILIKVIASIERQINGS